MPLSDRQLEIVKLLDSCNYKEVENLPCPYCDDLIQEFLTLANREENDK